MFDLAYDDYSFDTDEEMFFESDEDKVHEMIEKFISEETKKKEPVRIHQSGRGRPRKHFTKTVTFVEMEASGWLKKASRGRPKKGEVRVEVMVPIGVEIAPERFYTYENGVLAETWTNHEQR